MMYNENDEALWVDLKLTDYRTNALEGIPKNKNIEIFSSKISEISFSETDKNITFLTPNSVIVETD